VHHIDSSYMLPANFIQTDELQIPQPTAAITNIVPVYIHNPKLSTTYKFLPQISTNHVVCVYTVLLECRMKDVPLPTDLLWCLDNNKGIAGGFDHV